LGADDYITKPFDVEELNLRVRNAIARARYESLTSPTTGLPSGRLIEEQLRELMRRDSWAILYVGIQGFSHFGEVYGFVAGEEVLRFTAMTMGDMVDDVGTPNDFIGHVGGDEFIIITQKEYMTPMIEEIKQRFDEKVGTHYDWRARERGYLVVEDDDGNTTKVDLMHLAVGTLTSDEGPFADIREITEAAASARREAARQE